MAADLDAALAEFDTTGNGHLATHHLDAGAFLRLDPNAPDPDFEAVFTPSLAEFYRSDGRLDRTRVVRRRSGTPQAPAAWGRMTARLSDLICGSMDLTGFGSVTRL